MASIHFGMWIADCGMPIFLAFRNPKSTLRNEQMLQIRIIFLINASNVALTASCESVETFVVVMQIDFMIEIFNKIRYFSKISNRPK
jgi:hypothetical protein